MPTVVVVSLRHTNQNSRAEVGSNNQEVGVVGTHILLVISNYVIIISVSKQLDPYF